MRTAQVLSPRSGLVLVALAALFVPNTAMAQWTVTNLTPTGAAGAAANGVNGGKQVGTVKLAGEDDYHATLWRGTAASLVDLHPAGATRSHAYAAAGGQQAGQAQVPGGFHAGLWSGTASSWVDLNPAGSTFSIAYGTDGAQQVGDAEVAGIRRASLWYGTAASWVDLHPAGAFGSNAFAVNGGQQVGSIDVLIDGIPQAHASLWTGTAASWIDLHPAGFAASEAYAIQDGQQGGYVWTGRISRASLWTSTASSWIDLSPVGSTDSQVNAIGAGYQGGEAVIAGVRRASLWNGSSASWEDLHAVLPPEYGGSFVTGIASDGINLYVVGGGTNQLTGYEEALLWTRPIPAPGAGSILAIGCVWGARRRLRPRSASSPQGRAARLAVAAAIAQLALPAMTANAAPIITDLGTLPGYSAISRPAVSANGLVVAGTVERNNLGLLERRAVRWTNSGGVLSLGLPVGTLEDSWTDARGLSADGSVIVGNVDEDQGFFWSVSTGFAEVPPYRLRGVNDAGTLAVGSEYVGPTSDMRVRAVLVGDDGSIAQLGVGGLESFGSAISGNGAVAVGAVFGGLLGTGTAFRSTGPGEFELLGRLPGQDYSVPNAVNTDGSVVVGRSGIGNVDSAAPAHAFRWSTIGGLQDLGMLPGDNRSEAIAVNGEGTLIVGESGVWFGGQFPRAFLWSDGSGMLDLNEYLPTIGVDLEGWMLTSATGISADGSVIVGQGVFNGAGASWIVTGVPSPPSCAMFVLAGAVFSRRRRPDSESCDSLEQARLRIAAWSKPGLHRGVLAAQHD